MRSPRSLVVVSTLLALAPAVSGCGSEETSDDPRPLVTFAKSGGASGKAYSLVVDRGGGATLTTYPPKTKRFVIDGGKRDDLVGLLDGIGDLQSSYESARPSAEQFRYSLTYQAKTVQATEGAELPDVLRSVIDLLDGIVSDES